MTAGDLILLSVKGVIGGAVVVMFAVLGEVLRPRAVAGVTSGAPSVAIASLGVTAATAGSVAAAGQARGMIAGAVALVVWCLCGLDTVKRFGALRGSVLATVVWLACATALWAIVLR